MAKMLFQHVSEAERKLMKRLHDSGSGVGKIAKQLGRSKDTVHKHVFAKNAKKATKPKGRPVAYCRTPAGFAAMERVYKKLLRASKGKTEVTPQMLKDHMGLTCSPQASAGRFERTVFTSAPCARSRT